MADGLLVGLDRPEEPPVPDGQPLAAVDLHGVLVKVTSLHYGACVVPPKHVVAVLVLDHRCVTYLQRH